MKARKILLVLSGTLVLLSVCAIIALALKDKLFGPPDPYADVQRVIKLEASYGKFITEDDYGDGSALRNRANQNCVRPALCVPTIIKYFDGLYFIADCYNDQIIYSDDLSKGTYEWKIMTYDVKEPHSVDSDGNVYLVDDTENNRVKVYRKAVNADGEVWFYGCQIFDGIGNRPHYTYYNEADATFYAWSSESGEMFLFKYMSEQDAVALVEKRIVPELSGVYVRSFTIRGDSIFFVSNLADANIYQCNLETFKVEKKYKVSDELAGMVQITFADETIVITVSTDREGNTSARNLITCTSLEDLENGNYVSYYDLFASAGTPYNITMIGEDTYYVTAHNASGTSQVMSFQIENGAIVNIQRYF